MHAKIEYRKNAREEKKERANPMQKFLNSKIFKVCDIIIQDFKKRNRAYYEKKGIPTLHFCSIVNDIIHTYSTIGFAKGFCGYALDYLIYFEEIKKITFVSGDHFKEVSK